MAVFSAAFPLLLLFLSVSSLSVNGNTAPAAECSTVFLTLSKCLPFVMIGSQVEKPETACCSNLKTVLDTKAECLCEGLKSSAAMGINLNVTKAETLPAACKLLNAPPMSACALSTKPPASAPAPVPAAGPPKGSGPGSSSAPAPSPSHGNHGSSISVLSFAISGALVILFARI
ncbi:Non-specific lipid transfer protein GPI-anchored 29 [Hirschfeldia incana]|nr:Non-specific lipid transfer protein GPI-anchored 29 [Hirschfeldia incana]